MAIVPTRLHQMTYVFHCEEQTQKNLQHSSEQELEDEEEQVDCVSKTGGGNPTLALLFRSRQYGWSNGRPVVTFTTAEFAAGVALFKHSVITKFTVGRPPISKIRSILKKHWDIKGRATLSDIWDARHIMVILDSEPDAVTAYTSPIRKVGHAMF
ncbi:hypothetical protein QQ045_027434 [Rhodiola kirilowii]